MGISKHELKFAQLVDHLDRLEQEEKWKDALKLCDQVIKTAKKISEGDVISAYHRKVLAAYEVQDYVAAIKALEYLHKKQPSDTEWVVLLASAFGEAKKYKQAVKYFEAAFLLLDKDAEDYHAVVDGLIAMYHESKQFDRGLEFLESKGLDKDGKNPIILVGLGNLCLEKEKAELVELGMRWFEKAVRQDKDHDASKYALKVIELFLDEPNTYQFLQKVRDMKYKNAGMPRPAPEK